jgi:hypothetical protein
MENGKRLIIKIDALGRPTIEAQGYSGDECIHATAPFEKALGGGDLEVDRVMKEEWVEGEQQTNQQTQGW